MTIKILPARLANQIAAGEVVERPASVIKELVENSIDSGATRIDIDIEKGGAKLIRVRDNGKGIVKDELQLALSRHATSKIHTLDDLEAIVSLGFRGEALASISSVSRLTMTSRPAAQEQAWSAYAEGRDMTVSLKPTAHPIGTTVEVLDLFFNTPARRKFLRTEKTEFTHIDELLKRIALSRFDVSINVKHNGKLIRQYRAAKTSEQAEKRIASVCGSAFVRHMLRIELEHHDLKLHGWITTPEGGRAQNDLQYCYVNGRMMRDKLINHAIRQSYESSLAPEQYAAFVLFIDIDPHQVDVNVHPAKHEVRFHQARLVHDFIYQALSDALVQAKSIEAPQASSAGFSQAEALDKPLSQQKTCDDQALVAGPGIINNENANPVEPSVIDAVESIPAYPGRNDYQPRDTTQSRDATSCQETPSPRSMEDGLRADHQIAERSPANYWSPETSSVKKSSDPSQRNASQRVMTKPPSLAEAQVYQDLLQTPHLSSETVAKSDELLPDIPSTLDINIEQIGKAMSVVGERYVLVKAVPICALVSLQRAEFYKLYAQLNPTTGRLMMQPLLVPLSLKVSDEQRVQAESQADLLLNFGIDIKVRNKQTIMVMGVPSPLRQQNLQLLIDEMLSYLTTLEQHDLSQSRLSLWLTKQVLQVKSCYTLSESVQLLSNLEQLYDGKLPLSDTKFVRPVDFTATIAAFSS
ncbi:DNA mismatch repair protein MutL [Vibrio sp. 10N.286.49.C2]|uniref:DNA mismatch repair endonuclease MutL n=1 Tax=unclassified Vibrio TaxID=2614977 RepID=UPI000C85B481|nr:MULTISPECIES: DNA mismatch repair endonuclease MutL [unclassified Vibrio]PMH41854.1 DNA mismatch repair protein MutL [Vibrio sp. 10N.286.49.C2]PMH48167.1 DNA mismatch repair protein MutL [Vibrio sp. 10N.286.49.B1]PMH81150.1 DNA mismatch repair protein MutL [Vibrio sp. 10N.286.48.B7]